MEMNALIRESERIDARLDELFTNAKSRIDELNNRLESLNEDYKRAKADGDLRENASYEEAIKGIQEAQGDRQRWELLADGISSVKNKMRDYVHQDKVTIYSTVHLICISKPGQNVISNIEHEFIFKLFPYGITDVESGILSIDSVVGGKLLDKRLGEVIRFRDKSSGNFAEFRIDGFY